MKKNRIIYIGSFSLPDKNAAAHRVLNNCMILSQLGYNLSLIDLQEETDNKKRNIICYDWWSRRHPNSIIENIVYAISISEVSRIIDSYNDVCMIICYNYPGIALSRIISKYKKRGIKIVSDCTEWYSTGNLFKKIDNEVRMRRSQKKTDGVICISNYLMKYYAKYTKTVVIPPLVNTDELIWKNKKVEFEDECKHFVYSGTTGKHKDKLDIIIKALSSRNNKAKWKLHIIGLTKKQFIDMYPEYEQISDIDNIDFMGRVSHEESIRYVKSADFTVFIRDNTRVNNAGFPTKFVESVSSATPFVTTPTSDLKESVENKALGLFSEGFDDEKVCEVILKAVNMDEKEYKSLKYQCEKNKAMFDYRNYINTMRDFVNSVTGEELLNE